MKILLVMPFMAFDENKYLSSNDSAFPIGRYIAASLEKAGYIVHVFDFQYKKNSIKNFENVLSSERYDVVGFSVTSVTRTNTIKLFELVKEILEDCVVIVGGAYPTVYKTELIKKTKTIDYEVIGEGEITTVNLLKAIRSNDDIRSIKGVVYLNKEFTPVFTGHRDLIENLDEIPFPAFHLFDLDEYSSPPGMFFKLPLRHMITSRGCPFKCEFCDDRVIWQGKCRLRSAENIVEEMEYLIKRCGANEIHFYDDTFTVNRKRVTKICNLIKQKGLSIFWRCSSRVDTVSKEMLIEMHEAGCRIMSYGIESGDDNILKRMNKGTTVDQARKAIKWTNEAKIQAKGFFMMNYPGETIETTEKTIALSKELNLDFAGFNLTIPHHGEKLNKMVKSNYELNKNVYYKDDASLGNEIYFYQPGLPEDYLIKAYKRAAIGFYLRPKYVLRMVTRIRNFNMLKSYFIGFIRLFKIRVKNWRNKNEYN